MIITIRTLFMFPIDRSAGELLLLKHTGCPDCLVLKSEANSAAPLMLLSKENITYQNNQKNIEIREKR